MMDRIERAGLIRRTAEFIETGKKCGTLDLCLSPKMLEELNASINELGESDLYPHTASMNFGAVMMDLDEDGSMRLRYEIRDDFRNEMKNLQGGMMAAIVDNAFAVAIVPTYGPFLSMNIDINYLAPVSAEFTWIDIVIKTIKPGKNTKYLQAEVYRSDGRCAALAGSNIMMVK